MQVLWDLDCTNLKMVTLQSFEAPVPICQSIQLSVLEESKLQQYRCENRKSLKYGPFIAVI